MTKSHVAILSLSAIAALSSCVSLQERSPEAVVQAAQPATPIAVKLDLARGRRWELGWGAVAVYDAATNRPIRRIVLEGANLTSARGSCLPDLVLDRSGALLVSSNVQPVLWRVSPERFEVERFELRLEGDRGQDVGFSNLTWSGDRNALYALAASTRTPWHIDLTAMKASRRVEGNVAAGTC
jgi:hypothetical protein